MEELEFVKDGDQLSDEEAPIASYPNDPSVPDVFAEGVGVQVNLASLSLIFNRMEGYPPHPQSVAVIRMTLPQAVIMTQVLRRALRAYNEKVGPIQVPDEMLAPLDLDTEL